MVTLARQVRLLRMCSALLWLGPPWARGVIRRLFRSSATEYLSVQSFHLFPGTFYSPPSAAGSLARAYVSTTM